TVELSAGKLLEIRRLLDSYQQITGRMLRRRRTAVSIFSRESSSPGREFAGQREIRLSQSLLIGIRVFARDENVAAYVIAWRRCGGGTAEAVLSVFRERIADLRQTDLTVGSSEQSDENRSP